MLRLIDRVETGRIITRTIGREEPEPSVRSSADDTCVDARACNIASWLRKILPSPFDLTHRTATAHIDNLRKKWRVVSAELLTSDDWLPGLQTLV